MKQSNKLLRIGILTLILGSLLHILFIYTWITKKAFFDNVLFPLIVESLKCCGTALIVASFVPKSDNFAVLSERQRKNCIQEILAYEEEVRDSNTDISMYFSDYIDELFDLCRKTYRTDYKYIIEMHYDNEKACLYSQITTEYKEYRIKGSLQEHFFGYYEENAENTRLCFFNKNNAIIQIETELEKKSENTPLNFPKKHPFINDKNVKIIKYVKLPAGVDKNNFIRIEKEDKQYGKENSNIMLVGLGVIKPSFGMDIQINLHDNIVLVDQNTFGDFVPDSMHNTETSIRLTSHEWMRSGIGVDFVFKKI